MEFSLAGVAAAVAAAVPDHEALVFGDRRLRHSELAERSRRFANLLLAHGLELERERGELANHESGQAHCALYLYNGNEYVESMFGSFAARVAPVNVNYRYVEEELLYLLGNSQARALVYHAEFAPRVAAIRAKLPKLELLVQVADDSGEKLLDGALDYEAALASASPGEPRVTPSPDDLYILYTGGTTGMPKGVLWRSDDIFISAMGGRRQDGSAIPSYEALAEQVKAGAAAGAKGLIGPPLMHGAAQWVLMNSFVGGATIVLPREVKRFDARDFLATAERERVASVSIVGDAFARPIIDELRARTYDLSSLRVVGSGGAQLSATSKAGLLELIPSAIVWDGMGSSEGGLQAGSVSTRGNVTAGSFNAAIDSVVVSDDLSRVLEPGEREEGWLAMRGRKPLGYLGDPEKTARTFPEIGGRRYSVPGDRARYNEQGGIDLLGRDSVCINSGGEKIFAEEVEAALKAHADVFDVVVAPRASERWGQEVVAVVALRKGAARDEASLLAECERHVARYKLPKAFVFVPEVQRSPSGKPDYRWAKARAEAGN